MIADATTSTAVTAWNNPTPPATSDVRCRRAPAIDAANAPLASTNDASKRKVPKEATYLPEGLADSYRDGHFAMTPSGSTWKPSAASLPRSTTSDPSLKVSGTTPV